MKMDLRILILEDTPTDAELMERELRKAGIVFISKRVDTREAFIHALDDFRPDVILSDYHLPDIDGMAALRILQLDDPEVPVIIVTGALPDIDAVELIQAGAKDYVLKDRLARLAPAVQRALSAAQGDRARKAAEQALLESEEKFRSLVESTSDWIWEVDKNGLYSYSSPKCKDILGYEVGEILGRSPFDFMPQEEIEQTYAKILQFAQTQKPFWQVEKKHLHKDGHLVVIETSGVPYFDLDGARLGYRGVDRDITERKRIQHQMELLERAVNLSVDAIFLVDEQLRFNYVNAAACRSLGYSRDELLSMGPCDIDPGVSREFIRESMDATFADDKLTFETRHRARDGRVFPVEISISYFEDNGKKFSFCLARDITERKQTEEALRLSDMVYTNTGEAILVTDTNNQIIAVNPAFTEITGYTEADAIGKDPRILSSGLQDKSFYQEMWGQLNTAGRWQGEIFNRRKNDDIYAEQLSISTIYNKDGSVHRRIGLFMDVTERKKSEEVIWKQANFDLLTGLPNRSMFQDRLEQEIKKAKHARERFALLFIDIDQFKEVNDVLGHHAGDDLLIEAAKRLSSCIRETDTLARLGGDEFTVLLTLPKDLGDIDNFAQDITKKLAEPFYLRNELVYVTASIGIAIFPDDAKQYDQLLQFADQAMYVAKEQGRNRYAYYTSALHVAAQERMRLITELREALPLGQLRVYFQPIVEFGTEKVFKAEALLRWQHPQRGLVSPMTFIPLAEETGLINEIGEWVFHESMRWAKSWTELTKEEFQISVNKSPVQFRSHDNAGKAWPDYLQEMGLTGRHIAIEITEGLLLNKDDLTGRKLLAFRDAGIQVSIDDFGTGYSALSYLKKFDIDYLKIDRSFVRNMANDPSDFALCEAIIMMAHKLGLKVIAEGVETRAQRDLLIGIGCDFGQGYLFAKPLPGEEMDALLRSKSRVPD